MIDTNPESRRKERGVVYIATGEGCRREAIRSAKSVKQHNPSIAIAIYTEISVVDPVFDFTFLIEKPEFSAIDKVKNLWRTPFHKSIYIDADTIITGNLLPLFDLLDRVDFAGAHETARGYWYKELQSQIPEAFGEVNTGVMVFKATSAVIGLLKDWHEAYLETCKWLPRFGTAKWMLTNEQPAMRHLLYHRSEVKLWVLPTEYNALRNFGTYLWGKAIVVHGRGNIEAVAERMNRFTNVERGFFQGLGVIADFNRLPLSAVLETVTRVHACAAQTIWFRIKNLWSKKQRSTDR